MTNDITAGSFVSVNQAKQSSNNGNQQTVLPSDSFKVVAKIANSSRLSETEKSGLISNVALIDKYAKGSLRSKMLNSVAATTLFLERFGNSKPAPKVDLNQAAQQFKQAQQISPAASRNKAELQTQVTSVQKRVEALPKQTANVSLPEINQRIPQADVQAVFAQPVESVARQSNVEVKAIPTLAEARQSAQANTSLEVRDDVALSPNAQAVQALTIPGSGDSAENVALPGSGASEVAVPLPGGGGSDIDIPVLGSGDFEEVALPGGGSADIEADIAARIALLEDRGIPDLPLPGGASVSEVAAQIEAAPEQAIKSIGQLILPGGAEADNGSVNERAAHVALSV